MENNKFKFELSLTVLNHLGRNLYRNFSTILGEAISNSWDADAEKVEIFIDKKNNNFIIKDDGIGMNENDFQNKFLKIGYSKRKTGQEKSQKGRPFIGRKGIGKLALLSCADRIIIFSKTGSCSTHNGGIVDNSNLDEAIGEDEEYLLDVLEDDIRKKFSSYTDNHSQGTVIVFENIKTGIKNSLEHIKKIVAFYFRFSLLDPNFSIYIDNKEISIDELNHLVEKTQFLWVLNNFEDPYIDNLRENIANENAIKTKEEIKGFFASVNKPRDLAIMGTEERVGVDLFVNGRMRKANIFEGVPTARLAESYFYGQIHIDVLDEGEDRFTTNREGIISTDSTYRDFFEILRAEFRKILDAWDDLRIGNRERGDPENENSTISKSQRASRDLASSKIAELTELQKGSKNQKKINEWCKDLFDDAYFNSDAYAECFISENLVRKYLCEEKPEVLLGDDDKTKALKDSIKGYRKLEDDNKREANLSIKLRKHKNDLDYLKMDNLISLTADELQSNKNNLKLDSGAYRPIRNVIMHTARLTDEAKLKLTSVYDNIKARILTLLS